MRPARSVWTTSSRKPAVLLLLLSVWIYVLFFHRLADRDLWNSHEARAGMNAQTMIDDGQWLVPRLYDGQWEVQKPAGYYWMVAGIAKLRGGRVDTWAVRLPSTLSALGCAVILALFGWQRRRWRAGVIAALVLSSAVHFTWLGRVGRIDLPMTFCVSIALLCYYQIVAGTLRVPSGRHADRACYFDGRHVERACCLVLGYLALAMGVLLKGPIAFLLPAGVVFVHLTVEKRLPLLWQVRCWARLLHGLGVWWGIPLVLIVTVPYYWLANQQSDGQFFESFLWLHNVQRGLGGSRLREHPWWLYGPQFLLDFLPWSVLLPPLVWRFVRRRRWHTDPEARFGLTWLLTILVLLSFARYKRADYLMPAYPGAALFLGCVLARRWQTQTTCILPAVRWEPAICAATLLVIAVGWFARVEWWLPQLEPQREHQRFAEEIRRQAPQPNEIIFFRTEAHALAFHLGRPMRTLVHWRDLEQCAAQPQGTYVVMPASVAAECSRRLRKVRLEKLVSNSDLIAVEHEKPLVFVLASGKREPPVTASRPTDRAPHR